MLPLAYGNSCSYSFAQKVGVLPLYPLVPRGTSIAIPHSSLAFQGYPGLPTITPSR
jgi:hypothetical protein